MGYGKWITAAVVLTGAFFVVGAWGDYLIAEETIGDVTYTLTSPTEHGVLIPEPVGGANYMNSGFSHRSHIVTGVPDPHSGVYRIHVLYNTYYKHYGNNYYVYRDSGGANWSTPVSLSDYFSGRCKIGSIAADFEGHVYIAASDFTGVNFENIGDYEVFEVLGDASFGEPEVALPAAYGNYWSDAGGANLVVSRNGQHLVVIGQSSFYPDVFDFSSWAARKPDAGVPGWGDPVILSTFESRDRSMDHHAYGAVQDDGTFYVWTYPGYMYTYPPFYPFNNGIGLHYSQQDCDIGEFGGFGTWYGNGVYDFRIEDDMDYANTYFYSAITFYPDSNGYIHFGRFYNYPGESSAGLFNMSPAGELSTLYAPGEFGVDSDHPQMALWESLGGAEEFIVVCYSKAEPAQPKLKWPARLRIFKWNGGADYQEIFGEDDIYLDFNEDLYEEDRHKQIYCNIATSKNESDNTFDIHVLWTSQNYRVNEDGDHIVIESDVYCREFTLTYEEVR